ncbi:MAG: hypothetical protein HQL41_11505 [Alphaproteobacteria bacterium]|nr:hypothetical protein [Alphaproteobacteria bacterium]
MLAITDGAVITDGIFSRLSSVEKIQLLANVGGQSVALGPLSEATGIVGVDASAVGGFGVLVDASARATGVHVTGGGGADTLKGGAGDDSVAAGGGDDQIIGGSGLGNDTYAGGAGNDSVHYTSTTLGVAVSLLAGTAVGAEIGSDTLSGIEGVLGGTGNDTLTGGAGNDYFYGDAGHDNFVFAAANWGGDTIDGAAGSDQLRITGVASITASGLANVTSVETLKLVDDGAGHSVVLGSNADLAGLTTVYAGTMISGSSTVAIDLSGRSLGTTVTGGAGTDSVTGGVGNDYFDGGAGNDVFLRGGQSGSATFGGGTSWLTIADTVTGAVDGVRNVETVTFSGSGEAVTISRMPAATAVAASGIQTEGVVVARLDGGYWLVHNSDADSGSTGIYATPYGHDGVAGTPVALTATGSVSESLPAASTWPDGSMVVVWTGDDAAGSGVFSARLDAAGTKGVTTQVNVTTTGSQSAPAVAALQNGGHVVAWESTGSVLGDSDGAVVYRVFDASGTGGSELLVGTGDPSGVQTSPAVASAPGGGSFIIAWQSGTDIMVQICNADGTGTPTILNVGDAGTNTDAEIVVSVSPMGGYVVAWSTESPSSSRDVQRCVIDSDRTIASVATTMHATTTGDQHAPALAHLPNGAYLLTWIDGGTTLMGRMYGADGTVVGTTFTIHSGTATLDAPSVVALRTGHFAVSWGDATNGDVVSAIVDGGGATESWRLVGDAVGNTLVSTGGIGRIEGGAGSDTITGSTGREYLDGGAGADTVKGEGGDDVVCGGTGTDSLSGGAGYDLLVVDDLGADVIDGGADSDILRVQSSSALTMADADFALYTSIEGLEFRGSQTVTLTLGANALASGLKWIDGYAQTGAMTVDGSAFGADQWIAAGAGADSVQGGAGNDEIDGWAGDDVLSGGAGNDYLRGDDGDDTLTGGDGDDWFTGGNGQDVAVIGMTLGEATISGSSTGLFLDKAGQSDYVAQTETLIFSDASVTVERPPSETRLNATATGSQTEVELTALADGGYVTAWVTDGLGVFFQRYDSGKTAVNAVTQVGSDVAANEIATCALDNGGWVIAWNETTPASANGAINAMIYDDAGASTAITIDDTTQANDVEIAGLPGGGFVAVWECTSPADTGATSGVRFSTFDPAGNRLQTGEVNTTTAGDQIDPDVAALADGGFVVVWETDGGGIWGQKYGPDGLVVGAEFQVSDTVGAQSDPAVTALEDGGFAVVWTIGGAVWGQAWTAAGTASGAFEVDGSATNCADADITGLFGGGFMVTWTGYDAASAPSVAQGRVFQVISGNVYAVNNDDFILSTSTMEQDRATVAQLGTGEVITAWVSEHQDGDAWGAYGQIVDQTGLSAIKLTGDANANQFNISVGVGWVDGAAGDDTLSGGSFSQRLDGGAGNDKLYGGTGEDMLVGGTGNDTLDGGVGNDRLVMSDLDANDSLSGGTGNDVLRLTAAMTLAMSGLSITGVETLVLDAVAGLSVSLDDAVAIGKVHVRLGAATVDGTAVSTAVTITGGAGSDSLLGGSGDDTIWAGAGDDTVSGGTGNDVLGGGVGADVLSFSSDATGLTVDMGAGTASGAASGDDTISGFEVLIGGSGDDSLVGGSAACTISGGAGNDEIVSGAAGGEFDGGAGDDMLNLAAMAAGVALVMNGATAAGFTSGAVTGSVVNFEYVTGSAHGDDLTGDASNNLLLGQDGNDTLDGGPGNDTISAGNGDDVLWSTDGSDTLMGGLGTDRVEFSSRASGVSVNMTTGIATSGADTINLDVENVSGSNYADTIAGYTIAETLWGWSGTDSIDGGDGDDTIYGNDDADTLVGGVGGDVLYGGGGNDSLDGGSGNDTIHTGSGYDTIAGNAGEIDVVDFSEATVGTLNGLGATIANWDASDLIRLPDAVFGLGATGLVAGTNYFEDTVGGIDGTLYGAGASLIVVGGGTDAEIWFQKADTTSYQIATVTGMGAVASSEVTAVSASNFTGY